uniref:ATP synthase F0 subunit 8 n=1 Tax=Achatinella sowerbyana TaxID=115944 RepID=A0A343A152_9EUPU|nr:ATP synthase F0 subunit 8 [Achatinella sowerbyana]
MFKSIFFFYFSFCSKILIKKLPQLSPTNGLYMFMMLFIIFWMILFLIEFKFPMIYNFTNNNNKKIVKKIKYD